MDKREADECWPWTGARTPGGYGQLGTGLTRKGQQQRQLATHISLAIAGRGRPSKKHVAMHTCDKPWCVNPAHLRWGTTAENYADMVRKGRASWQGGAKLDLLDPEVVAKQMDEAAGLLGSTSRGGKMNADLVRYVRSSPKTTIALAAELDVTNQCISDIRRRRTWKAIE